ncbi:DUF2624 domain-containing protein [Cerasibacillus terrae]|uniref:DUF2624 domain-containing protein n=1 Tax=Cerasibacillus terrae TaxID=2498845 RepID=A0A5C8P2X7_9BACI|nr:DUF2624 family protein [Cerasibacillus terrae]TXL67990.1 DUF2624 domain-containing protein [Cerasibacillus terrae]
MSYLLKELIIRRLQLLSADEVLYYSKQYGFSISKEEAKDIVSYLKSNPVQPFHKKGKEKMLTDLANITSIETAIKARNLLEELIQSHGLQHLFNE